MLINQLGGIDKVKNRLQGEELTKELPKMTIGYICNQYDCDGKIATTMKLDESIKLYEDENETCSMFQVGAPVGHLTKYRRC